MGTAGRAGGEHVKLTAFERKMAQVSGDCTNQGDSTPAAREGLNGYDYINQAWVVNGVYMRCSHPGETCKCYGRLHAGEAVADPANVR